MDVDSFDVQYLFDDGNGKGEPLVTFLYTSLGCKCTHSFHVQITFHNFPSRCYNHLNDSINYYFFNPVLLGILRAGRGKGSELNAYGPYDWKLLKE